MKMGGNEDERRAAEANEDGRDGMERQKQQVSEGMSWRKPRVLISLQVRGKVFTRFILFIFEPAEVEEVGLLVAD